MRNKLLMFLVASMFASIVQAQTVRASNGCTDNIVKYGVYKGYTSRCSSSLRVGENMIRGQFIMSDGTRTLLIFQKDGNLVLYGPNKKVLWQSRTRNSRASVLRVQNDGNVVLYTSDNKPVWALGTKQSEHRSTIHLHLNPDGNMVLYPGAGGVLPIWASNTKGLAGSTLYAGGTFNLVTNIKRANYSYPHPLCRLKKNMHITSANKQYIFISQSDGNLVVYGPGLTPLWSSRTAGKDSHCLATQPDGNVVLLGIIKPSKTLQPTWHLWQNTTNRSKISYFIIQNDGNLVFRDVNNAAIWSTGTN